MYSAIFFYRFTDNVIARDTRDISHGYSSNIRIRRIFVGFATNRTFVKFEPIRSDRSPSVGYILFNKGITFLYKLYYTKDICNYYIF